MTTLTATASVATPTAERYAKQLASHLGRRTPPQVEEDGVRLFIADGECLLRYTDVALELHAAAPTAETLTLVTDVVGRHLARFGQRTDLRVIWSPPA